MGGWSEVDDAFCGSVKCGGLGGWTASWTDPDECDGPRASCSGSSEYSSGLVSGAPIYFRIDPAKLQISLDD